MLVELDKLMSSISNTIQQCILLTLGSCRENQDFVRWVFMHILYRDHMFEIGKVQMFYDRHVGLHCASFYYHIASIFLGTLDKLDDTLYLGCECSNE